MNLMMLSSLLLPIVLFAQYIYEGPTSPEPNSSSLIKVEIMVRDDPTTGVGEILSVTFAGEEIPLKPADIFGNRGAASFQLLPGKYQLVWVVQRSKRVWPRTITHRADVIVDPRDVWVQVLIQGEKVSIQ
ncbi:MAG: hypothetical protein KGI80_04320 [Verrucomicrobiota bacterium]|nr:hypothetical protein [Verrucomicrobiota bacterium]